MSYFIHLCKFFVCAQCLNQPVYLYSIKCYSLYNQIKHQGSSEAQVVRRSPPTAKGPEFASRSLHVDFVVDETESGFVFPRVFPVFPLPQISFHQFSTLISLISFHLISSAPVMVHQSVVGRHCHSQTINKGISSHPIPRLGPVLCTS